MELVPPRKPPARITAATARCLSDAQYAFLLGRGAFPLARETCHSFANGCSCDACEAMQAHAKEHGFTPAGKLKPPPAPVQPWEAEAA
jgi:hypothetical protein